MNVMYSYIHTHTHSEVMDAFVSKYIGKCIIVCTHMQVDSNQM